MQTKFAAERKDLFHVHLDYNDPISVAWSTSLPAVPVRVAQTVSLRAGRGRALELGIRTGLMFPVEVRYAWPAELDLMARLAGLSLKDRWSDWKGSEFLNRVITEDSWRWPQLSLATRD